MSVPRAVAALAIPSVVGQLITMVYNFADTWFVGRTNDPEMVAAVSICLPCMMLSSALGNLFGVGGASLISRAMGSHDAARAARGASFALWGGAVSALSYALLLLFLGEPLLKLLGAGGNTLRYASKYVFFAATLGAAPNALNVLLSHLIRSEGRAARAALGVSLGAVLNILLDPIFMFVLFPKGMEVEGAAVATLTASLVSTVYFINCVLRQRRESVISLRPHPKCLRDGVPAEVVGVGLPVAVMQLLAQISNGVVTALMSPYGVAAVSGMGIVKKFAMLIFYTTQGISQGALPLVSYSYAAGNYRRMKAAILWIGGSVLVFSTLCLALYLTIPHALVGLFIRDSETVEYGASFLRILSLCEPFCALGITAVTVFQALGQKKQALVISVLRKGGIDIPLMIVLNRLLSANGIVWTTPICDFLASCVAAAMLLRFLRRLRPPDDPSETT